MTVKVRGKTLWWRLQFPTQTLEPGDRYFFDFIKTYYALGLSNYGQAVKVLPPTVRGDGTVVDRIEHTVGRETKLREGDNINEPRITGRKGVFLGGVKIEVVSVPPDRPSRWRRSHER